ARVSRRARPCVFCAALLHLTALLLVAQIQLPPPRGYVNDFAAALDSPSVAHMEAVIAEVRVKTRGEIAVVTLPDIADRPVADVALEIGRRWGVGAKGEAGDPAKNLGVVVLLVPLKNHRAGTGQIFIATGRGAEGFLTDARAGRIRDAMTPYLYNAYIPRFPQVLTAKLLGKGPRPYFELETPGAAQAPKVDFSR